MARGNLHAHSTRSDGTRDPQEVVDIYARLGRDFFVLTDHDIFSNYTDLDAKGMILIPGNEVSAYGNHILQIGGTKKIDPHEDRQHVIDQINADGGLAILNHPNWEANWNHCPFELMLQLKGYAGMEIFNGVCLRLEGGAYASDKWDRMLSAGRMVWGFANDDSHRPGDDGYGWNVVQVEKEQATAAGILAALRAGQFYASTGVTINTIETHGSELHLTTANAHEIEIYGDKGKRLAWAKGSEIRFDVGETNTFFIRAQCYGVGTQMAWTQPLIVRGGVADTRLKLEEQFGRPDSPRPTLGALRVEAIPPLGSPQAEALWAKAVASELPYEMSTGNKPPVRTAVRALVDARQLALRVDCQEPDMSSIRAAITQDGEGNIWRDDSVEIFLDVEGDRKRCYHLMINSLGAFFVGHPTGLGKSLKYQKRAVRGPQEWTVEILLDLATLSPDKPIGPGTSLGFHVGRSRFTTGKKNCNYAWAWVGSSHHTLSRYGNLQL